MIFQMTLNLNIIKKLKPEGNIAVLLSNGLDSTVLYGLLKKVHNNITTINLIRPTLRDINYSADIHMELINGNSEYQRVRDTILYNIMPYYDQVWNGENAVPNKKWFLNHEDLPNRGTKEIDDGYYSPFLFLQKSEIIFLAKKYNIDIRRTVSCIVNQDTHCKNCWFCKEREYGYIENNLEVEW